MDAALQLINIARHIYIINITAALGGDAIMRQKVQDSKIVTVFNNTRVSAVLGESLVKGLKVKQQDKEEETLPVQGIFVEIGLIPNSDFAKGIEKNQFGEIKINSYNETNLAGIFAAGDVTDIADKQIIIAAGEGSKATLAAFRYLAHHNRTIR